MADRHFVSVDRRPVYASFHASESKVRGRISLFHDLGRATIWIERRSFDVKLYTVEERSGTPEEKRVSSRFVERVFHDLGMAAGAAQLKSITEE